MILMKAFPSVGRVQELMEIKSDEREKTPLLNDELIIGGSCNAKEISLKNVSYSYHGAGEMDLENINVEIPAGSVLGIIGGTGSGKSTLLKLLNHTYDVTEGTIEIGGQNVKSFDDSYLADMFGIVPQKAVLFEGTIRDNLLWGNENASDDEMMEAIELAQATEVIKNKGKGLDTVVEQNGRNFSGGQKQRLTIARALVRKPEILILDDSASALDFATDAKLRAAIAGHE